MKRSYKHFHEMTQNEKRELIKKMRWALDALPSALIREGASKEKLAMVRALIERGEGTIDRLEAEVLSGWNRHSLKN